MPTFPAYVFLGGGDGDEKASESAAVPALTYGGSRLAVYTGDVN